MILALRYLAPNVVTAIGLLFGLLSLVATHEQRFVDAGWFIVWAVLIDRLDGAVARMLQASTEFGTQLDSFADFLNFGIAPAFLVFASLEGTSGLGFDHGSRRALLAIACAVWALANAVRLARFNVAAAEGPAPVYFGVATTLAAGTLITWYLVLLKYAPADALLGAPDSFRFGKLLGDWEISAEAWNYLPIAMLVGAGLMVSNLPIPKLGRMSARWLTFTVLGLTLIGYACGITRSLPEVMGCMPAIWILTSLVWGLLSPNARGLKAPPWR